ncbi:MAG: hypothetical protein P4M11_14075 [Candidatus Pacebacteria bacterium]|nr:hypothetical protein [Candidatus Paceibacterota bacterium]
MDDTGQNFCHPIELKIFPSAQSDFFPPARQGPKRLSLDTFVRRRPTLASQTAKHRTHQSPSQIHISYDTRVPPVRGSRAVPVPMSLLHVRRRVPEQSEGMAKPAFDLEKRLAGLDFFALAGVDRNEFRLHIRQLAVRPPRSKSPPVSRLRLNTCSGPKKQNRCAVAQKLPRSKKQRDTSVMMSRTSQVAKRALNLSSNCSVGPVRSKETGKQPKPRVATEKRRVRHRPKPSLPPDEPVPEHDHSSKLQPIPTFVAQDYDYCVSEDVVSCKNSSRYSRGTTRR